MAERKKPAKGRPPAGKAKKKSTMEYYRENPESYRKKIEYEKKRAKSPKQRKNYNERKRFKRKHGLIGKMGNRDASHTKDGRIVLEKRSTNRSRNGEGGRKTKK